MRPAALALVAALAAPVARGQQPRKAAYDPPEPPVLNWEVTLGGAGGFGSRSADVERALRDAGYGQPYTAFGSTTFYPNSSGAFLSASFFPSVRFRLGKRFAAGVSGSSTKLGSTAGYGSSTLVSIQRSSADVALVFFWRPVSGVRLGAGPAWYRLTARPNGGDDLTASKIGWLGEAGLAFPDEGRLYADLGVQYRGTGHADFGTYTPPPSSGRAAAPIPLNAIGCEHGAFVAGVGFRF